MKSCIAPMSSVVGVQLECKEIVNPIHKVLKALDRGLGYEFHAAWGYVLQVFGQLYEVRFISGSLYLIAYTICTLKAIVLDLIVRETDSIVES